MTSTGQEADKKDRYETSYIRSELWRHNTIVMIMACMAGQHTNTACKRCKFQICLRALFLVWRNKIFSYNGFQRLILISLCNECFDIPCIPNSAPLLNTAQVVRSGRLKVSSIYTLQWEDVHSAK